MFCRHLQDFGAGGEKSKCAEKIEFSINANKSFPRNTSTISKSERHVSEGASVWAHFLFMYSDLPVLGLRGSARRGSALSFCALGMVFGGDIFKCMRISPKRILILRARRIREECNRLCGF